MYEPEEDEGEGGGGDRLLGLLFPFPFPFPFPFSFPFSFPFPFPFAVALALALGLGLVVSFFLAELGFFRSIRGRRSGLSLRKYLLRNSGSCHFLANPYMLSWRMNEGTLPCEKYFMSTSGAAVVSTNTTLFPSSDQVINPSVSLLLTISNVFAINLFVLSFIFSNTTPNRSLNNAESGSAERERGGASETGVAR